MPALSKNKLLDVTKKEYAKLFKLISSLDTKVAMEKRDDDISIKDIVAHRAHWIDLFLGWYADGQANKTVYFPSKGYKWSDLKRYNTELRESQSALDWPGATNMLQANSDRLIQFIEERSEEELYSRPMKGARNNWTTGRWAEAAGASHFRSASKYIRSILRKSK